MGKKKTEADKILEKTKSLTWWYVYVLQSKKDNSLYIGCTNDLKARVNKHNLGEVKSTKNKKPWGLIYYEAGKDKIPAFRRERYLKSGYGRRYLKKRLQLGTLVIRKANTLRPEGAMYFGP